MTETLNIIGARVQEAREAVGLSPADAAYRAELTTEALTQIERGEGGLTSTILIRLAKVFGVSTADLLRPRLVDALNKPEGVPADLRGVLDRLWEALCVFPSPPEKEVSDFIAALTLRALEEEQITKSKAKELLGMEVIRLYDDVASIALAARATGRSLRRSIEISSPVLLDFSEILVMSHCFADELFGVLLRDHGAEWLAEHVHYANANPDTEILIRRVLFERSPTTPIYLVSSGALRSFSLTRSHSGEGEPG